MTLKTFKCKTLSGRLSISTCILRHRRANIQDVFYMCKDCPTGALHEFNHGHEVVKEQKVIKESGRLENPAYLEQNMEMYSVHEGRLYSGHTLNVEA